MVKVLCQTPIKVRDGYFSRPRGSSDLLKAPARFPMPQSRVVLREVSVVWHLYGGKDFGGKPISAHTQHSHRSGGLVNCLTCINSDDKPADSVITIKIYSLLV